ncbi:uncharacterized protein MONBRDRAFT_33753 [Monosiga brevicollis MX1]|uniref:VCBS repeat-containing protein n=1 Tax=Monosiga brevicollis TaxID=81824 RepID=A9V795_MONBE|nr:uncharacterized protein MONBRDRAFT_33753 [Monosiga brevicollis MX1]EDQ86476.1 predicted protein [Monosiga brevicollis MX1]|eukprot:XP_001748589.1 hypothetical protein [Monosiga brevicollis MX1]
MAYQTRCGPGPYVGCLALAALWSIVAVRADVPSVTTDMAGNLHIASPQDVNVTAETVYVNGNPRVITAAAAWNAMVEADPFLLWQSPATEIVARDLSEPTAVHVADLDNDGWPDVIAACPVSRQLVWYRNLGTRKFGPAIEVALNLTTPSAVYAADLDQDGWVDLLSASEVDGHVLFHKNNGDAGFAVPLVLSMSAIGGHSITVADLDQDQHLDVLVAGGSNNTVAWFANRGDGTFAAPSFLPVTNAACVVAVDVDGNGALDVVVGSSSIGARWFPNHGNGSFASPIAITANSAVQQLATGDLDADGHEDLALLLPDEEAVVWYRNLGNGSFAATPRTITDGLYEGTDLLLVDVNADDHLDVVVASSSEGTVSWFRNSHAAAGAAFSSAMLVAAYDEYLGLATGDLDQDGHIDILSVSASSIPVAWYRNIDWNLL